MSEKQPEKKDIQIEIDEKTAVGCYSNFAAISHTQEEFIVDYVLVHPPKNKVNSRVIMSPRHAKRFLTALQDNIMQYEKRFGPIQATNQPPQFGINLSKN